MIKPNSYTIFDIKNNIDKVVLPSIQRGFVWKTDQMCYLWDSLLRGYPIGSFLASKNGSNKELLDGQQRMTTILSGFYNPFASDDVAENEILSLKKPPVLWIDLQPYHQPKENVYSILICTQSHPWGYRAENPRERISTRKINEFLERFSIEGNTYYQLLPKQYFPIDASYPIPLSFLLEAYQSGNNTNSRLDILKNNISSLSCTGVNYEELELDEKLRNLLQSVSLAEEVYIPELLIDLFKVKLTDEETVDDADKDRRDPTLFIRLNQNGTTIDADELIYSYYKSFFPKAKDLIESIGKGFISPKMTLNVFSRLSYFLVYQENATYHNPFTLEGFKNTFNNHSEFKIKLLELLPEEDSNPLSAKHRMEDLINLFKCYDNDASKKIPNSLIRSFLKDVHLVYIFLCFLDKIYYNSILKNNELDQKIVGLYMYIHLFSVNKKKLYKSLFDELVKNYNGEECVEFINQVFRNIQYAYISESSYIDADNKVFKIIPIDLIIDFIIGNKYSYKDINLFNQLCDENETFKKCFYLNADQNFLFITFIEKLRSNKELLLLAQRAYINDKFEAFESIDLIEDTNRPWDYDHIYPKNWTNSKNGGGRAIINIHWFVKEWVDTNGNYRALDFSSNRSDRDLIAPSKRLENKDAREKSFVSDEEFHDYWIHFKEREVIYNDKDDQLDVFMNAVLRRTSNIYTNIINTYFNF